ncbi:MAG: MBL fold metallo-hydrolase [Chloroflexia bacterium]|nr:MBL fold metallo-hydrolase [Chloroflexia bacterium]
MLLFINVNSFAQSISFAPINYYKLSERVLVVRTGDIYPDQVVAISTKEGIVIIDAGISPTLSAMYRKIIEKEFPNKRIKYVINTHHHFDHTNGNQVFTDATIIAHKNCSKQMEQFAKNVPGFMKSRKERYKRRWEIAQSLDTASLLYKRLRDLSFTSEMMCNDLEINYKLTMPNLTFNDKLNLRLGDICLEIYYFGKGFHTDNDIVIYIPEEELVFTGDLLQTYETNTYVTSECNFVKAIEVLNQITEPENKIKHIVTIHDGLLPSKRLKSTIDNLVSINYNIMNKQNAAKILEEAASKKDILRLLKKFQKLKKDTANYYFLEGDMNMLGEKLLSQKDFEKAIAIFEMNKELTPNSPDVYDWLGYAYITAGNDKLALKAFKKELELNPVSSYAFDMIKQIEKKQTH